MPSIWIVSAVKTISSALTGSVGGLLDGLFTYLWDVGLTLLNLITPRKKIKAIWPEYVPRKPTDSRGPCPFINALANHGVLPHDGRNITFKDMRRAANDYYNFSPTFTYFVCNSMAKVLKRNYSTDRLDLNDMCVHNGIEHDGSITRRDAFFQPDQSYPDEPLIKELLESCKDHKTLTAADCSRFLSKRFMDSRRNNGQFSLTSFQFFFGAANAGAMMVVCNGNLEELKSFLLEERAPEGWSTKVRNRFGITMASFNSTALSILLGIDPAWMKVK